MIKLIEQLKDVFEKEYSLDDTSWEDDAKFNKAQRAREREENAVPSNSPWTSFAVAFDMGVLDLDVLVFQWTLYPDLDEAENKVPPAMVLWSPLGDNINHGFVDAIRSISRIAEGWSNEKIVSIIRNLTPGE